MRAAIIVILALFLPAFVYMAVHDPDTRRMNEARRGQLDQTRSAQAGEREALLIRAQQAGIVRSWSVADGEVQVNGAVWSALPFDQKRDLAQFCALYMQDNRRYSDVKLRDSQTGRVVCECSAGGKIKIP